MKVSFRFHDFPHSCLSRWCRLQRIQATLLELLQVCLDELRTVAGASFPLLKGRSTILHSLSACAARHARDE